MRKNLRHLRNLRDKLIFSEKKKRKAYKSMAKIVNKYPVGIQTFEKIREKGIIMDKHRLSYHIRFNELNGTFCSGNLLPTKASAATALSFLMSRIML